MKNIVLIGMPGSGKSTLGVLLAKTLGKPFIDTDLLIQQNTGKLLQNIINEDGLDKFLKIEENVILELAINNSVIATGGSVIYSENSIKKLKENGILVYLKLTYNEIEKRVRNIKTRGIAKTQDQTLRDIYNTRIPLYEGCSDIVINCSSKNSEKIIFEIRQTIKQFH